MDGGERSCCTWSRQSSCCSGGSETPLAIPETVEIDFAADPPKPAVIKPARSKPAPTAKARTGKAQPSTRTRRVKLPNSPRFPVTTCSPPVGKEAGCAGRRGEAGVPQLPDRQRRTAGPAAPQEHVAGRRDRGAPREKGLASAENLPGIADRDAGSSAGVSTVDRGGNGGKSAAICRDIPPVQTSRHKCAWKLGDAQRISEIGPAGTESQCAVGRSRHERITKWRFEPLARKLPRKISDAS
jgi:hypothetical protein